MSSRRSAIIKESMESACLETQQMQEAEVDEYIEGVEVAEDEAQRETQIMALAAGMPVVTLEATVKELRNGMPVRFSHGHGKIAKIYTAPFLLDKKHHKASKEQPIYLVKHDKGGKHSLHKASALRLA